MTIIGEIRFPKTIPAGFAIPVTVVANALWLLGNQNSATFVGVNRTKGWAHPAIIWPIIAITNWDLIESDNRSTTKLTLLKALIETPIAVRSAPEYICVVKRKHLS